MNMRAQRTRRKEPVKRHRKSVLYVLAHSMLVVVLFVEHAEACASALMPWTVWPLRLETGVGSFLSEIVLRYWNTQCSKSSQGKLGKM